MKIQDANGRLHRQVTILWVVIAIVGIGLLAIFTARLISTLATP